MAASVVRLKCGNSLSDELRGGIAKFEMPFVLLNKEHDFVQIHDADICLGTDPHPTNKQRDAFPTAQIPIPSFESHRMKKSHHEVIERIPLQEWDSWQDPYI